MDGNNNWIKDVEREREEDNCVCGGEGKVGHWEDIGKVERRGKLIQYSVEVYIE